MNCEYLTRPSRKAGFLRLAGLKKSSRIFSDVSLLPFDTFVKFDDHLFNLGDEKIKHTELNVEGIMLWPNLKAAAANSLLILRYYLFKR